MEFARKERMLFGEVGGWAIAPERRCTIEPLRTILATYGLLRLLGGVTGIATATHRHGSAPILRRIGLSALEGGGLEMPPYYDPQYQCDMEILRFDSRYPAAKYETWTGELTSFLQTTPVVCAKHLAPSSQSVVPERRPIHGWLPAPVMAGSY